MNWLYDLGMNESQSKNEREKLVGELNPGLVDFFDAEDVDLEEDLLYPLQAGLAQDLHLQELKEIARGGEKRIIKAYDAKADRYIAVARPLDTSSEGRERFLREARITASLEHPNIISVYEMSLDESQQPFFSTELLQDRTLKKVIDEFHLRQNGQLEDLLDILLKVCDAMAYAHSHRVIHLDLKPDNIHVGAYGNVLVIDWGLAKIINEEDNLYLNESDLDSDLLNDMTLTGTLKGSPGYMAPEQTGLKGDKNQQTDIYALGALLYTVLTGEVHVDGETQTEVLENTRLGKVKPLPAKVPLGLSAVCIKALKLNPQDRYDSVEAFRSELQTYLRGFATQAEDAGFLKQLALLYKRKMYACQILIIALLIITLGTAAFIKELSLREQDAVALQQDAEKTLSLYEDGKRKRELMVDKLDFAIGDITNNVDNFQSIEERLPSLLVGSSITSSRKLDFEAAKELCNLALKKSPNNPLALSEKGFIHIIDHQFKAANDCFSLCATDASHIFEIHRLVKKYVKLKKDDSKRMDLEMTVNFVKELPEHRGWLSMYLLVRDRQLTKSLMKHSQLVKEFIYFNNPGMKKGDLNFEFTESGNGNSLSLAGSKNLTTLKQIAGTQFPFQSILYTLDLKYLDISDTDIKSIIPLKQHKLKEINISGTKMQWLSQLKNLNKEHLELIMIKKGQFKNFTGSRFENVEVLELP